MKLRHAAVVAVSALLLGLATTPGDPVSAQGQAQQSAAQRCFEHHRFGAKPVDVAKTADGQTVLAQTSWNWHDAIGCYLTLDQQALTTLRAALPPQDLPTGQTDASRRCFKHHKFGENPVDVAKTADGQTVVARLSWGYHNTIGCYLVLDNTALTTLRTARTDTEPEPDTDTDATDGATEEELLSVKVFSESEPEVKAGRSFEVAVEFNRAVGGFDADDMKVVNGDVTRFSGSGSEYDATVTAAALGTVVVLIPRAAALDHDGRSNEPSQPFARTHIAMVSTATAIAAGSFHSCAIRGDQTIACWGYNESGQADAPPGQYTAIATGYIHSCAIRGDQTIACWGEKSFGGTGAPPGQYTAIATGNYYSCAIRGDQTIACWGDNQDWEGNYTGQSDAPAGQFTAVAAGDDYSCAIRVDQTIACWGNKWFGGTDAPAGQFTAITTRYTHSCAIRVDQTIACWGRNSYGQIDVPQQSQFTVITPSGYISGSQSCGIRADQTIACWTHDGSGQLDASPGQFAAITPDDEFFDTWDREAVLADFTAEFNRQVPDHGWTGDIDGCAAGTTSQQYRDSIFQRVNWYRQMAGVDPVVENPEFSTLAQHAALIMAAQGSLSHYPPDDWACWTPDGDRGAGKSNLYLGRAGIYSINGYIQDPGANNLAVGHRRWILRPNSVEFGTGDIPTSQSGRRANALYVVPESRGGLNKTREERGFVAWPPPGYVPPAVNWGRWSFDLSEAHRPADFSTASVEASDEFGPVEVEIIHRHSSGIVWAMEGDTNSGLLSGRRPLHSLADSNYCYTVTISGVKINDSVQTPYEYAVCILTR